MRILVHAANQSSGGGLQKSLQVIEDALRWGGGHEWHFIVSPTIAENLRAELPRLQGRMTVLAPSPARPLMGHRTRRELLRIEEHFAPDVVYTTSGPAYARFRSRHVMGLGVPWLVYPRGLPWDVFAPWCRMQARLKYAAKLRCASWADEWVVQTGSAARGWEQRLGIAPDRVHVIPNGASRYFEGNGSPPDPLPSLGPSPEGEVRLLTLTAWYPHKNLEILPRVLARLRRLEPRIAWRSILSLDEAGGPWKRLQRIARGEGVADALHTLGAVPPAQAPALYRACDLLLLPSRLEVFSANYPEAMASSLPIATSNHAFARDVCGEAALYFDPLDPGAIAETVLRIVRNPDLRHLLAEEGRRQLKTFGTRQERFGKLVSVLAGEPAGGAHRGNERNPSG